MIYGLIEVEPKKNKRKIIIITVNVILVLILIGLSIFFSLNRSNFNISKNEVAKNNIINEVIENNVINKDDTSNKFIQKQKHIATINFLPQYNEQAKAKLANLYNGNEKVAYLTFDDGPSKSVTPLILDLLKQENIKATFFVLGSRVKSYPNLVKREYDEGHFIANHGYSHVYSSIYSSIDTILEEYNKTQNVIQNAIGEPYNGHLFRFPGGSTGGKYKKIKSEAKAVLAQNEIGFVDWNALSEDAAGAKTKEALIANIKATVGEKNVVVILMHDAGDKILTYETLPDVIAYLRERGYTFKNFYDIMQ